MRAAEALCGSGDAAMGPILAAGGQLEITVFEEALDIDVTTVSESQAPLAAFYLELSFDLRVPFGMRFLDTPDP
jgi:hypothetical protein